MWKISPATALGLVVALVTSPAAQPAPASRLAIIGVTIVDVRTGQPVPNQSVLVAGKPGAGFAVEVERLDPEMHLPVVRLRRVA